MASDGELEAIWKTLVPRAVELLHQAIREPGSAPDRLRWMAPALRNAYPGEATDDLTEVQGALASAVTEWIRRQQSGELSESPDEQELAFHLIRITYNRWQRKSRSEEPLRRAMELGAQPVDGRETSLVEGLAGKKMPAAPDFLQQLPSVVNEMLGSLSERDRQIVAMYLDKKPQTAIAAALDCHRATVGRVVALFRDHVAGLLREAQAD